MKRMARAIMRAHNDSALGALARAAEEIRKKLSRERLLKETETVLRPSCVIIIHICAHSLFPRTISVSRGE